MGVSGANVAVAETGTVITMTNEGNGRMVATLPKTHLYIFGIEKFVAKMSDIRYIFKVLPRNGTAQNITAYLSFYTGATKVVTDPENDTKEDKNFHMIILDTPERRKIMASEDYKDIFCCIRCAACLNVCPAFRLVGGHVYGGSIYTGGIGTLLTSFLNSRERGKDIQNICLQCGTCNTVCGGKLDIAGMILKLRTKFAQEDGLNPVHKFCLDTVADRHLFHSMLRIASVAQGMITKGQPMIRHLPMFLSGLTRRPQSAERCSAAVPRYPADDQTGCSQSEGQDRYLYGLSPRFRLCRHRNGRRQSPQHGWLYRRNAAWPGLLWCSGYLYGRC